MPLDILLYPHATLRENCEAVEEVDDEVRALLDEMAETMYIARGVGLAAPQVGITRRVIVIDVGEQGTRGDQIIELINPEIVETSEERKKGEEGCLSFPDIYGEVERHAWVRVEALNREGERFSMEGDGLLSVALQHEIDHLNGVLFLDYLGRLKQKMVKRKMQKMVKGLKEPVRRVG